MKRFSFIALVTTLMAGCVTSKSDDFIQYKHLPENATKKVICYTLDRASRATTSGMPDLNDMSSLPAGAWAGPQPLLVADRTFKSAFEPVATEIYSSDNRKGGAADINMKIVQQNWWNPAVTIPAFISGFTLMCLPCWGDDGYALFVEASSTTGLKKSYMIQRKITTYCWLPFIFAMPFVDMPGRAVNHITRENWKELRTKMESDGFFK